MDFFNWQMVVRNCIALYCKKSGNIVFQSSICTLNGFPKLVAYTAAKGAIAAITRQMASDYGEYNIRINAIARSTIETSLFRNLQTET